MRATVVPHASFESLLDSISGEWIAARSPVPQPVVIPSLPFSDYLQLRIADRFGVCMGLDFLTSRDFIYRAIGPHVENAWSQRNLTWRILPHVAEYASELGVAEATVRDLFALAGALADQFDQYAHFRPEIIRNWAEGRSGLTRERLSARDLETERWQRDLWAKLRAGTDERHPAEEFDRIRSDASFRKGLAKNFPRLLVLGSGVVDPLLVEVLGLLADAGGKVEVHVLLPSLEFLGDLRSRKALPSPTQDPESITAESGHPLLESMGRHAVGTFLLLERLDDQYTHWPEPGMLPPGKGDLLGRLQMDIRGLHQPQAEMPAIEDRSIRVHSCFGPRREMEVLKDEILRAFDEIPDLKPEEIHIAAPSLEIYAPLVAAILEQGETALAVRLMERPASGREPMLEGLLALLELACGGEFPASGLLELVQLQAVQMALDIFEDADGMEQVRGWIYQSGLTHGLGDGAAKTGTWEFARDRLIAGPWFGDEHAVIYPDGKFVLPVADQLAGDEALRSRFVEWHAQLECAMRRWATEAPPREWAERLAAACATVLTGEDNHQLAVQPHLAFLREVGCNEAVDAGSILDWLKSESAESARRTPVSGRIPFGRIKQLQNIPCRVLVLAGMQDGAFPGMSRPPAWDLLRLDPRAWDRNARVDDRQLFLDAVLTPRDRLIITASSRNVRTRQTEPFSSCVDELLRAVAAMGAPREELVIEHRLQPFAADYFQPDETMARSFNRDFAEVAQRFEDAREPAGIAFWDGTAAGLEQAVTDIPIAQLVEFWRDPAKAFLRAQGVSLAAGEEDETSLDYVPLSMDGLSAWSAKRAVVDELLTVDGNLDLAQASLRAERGLPPGYLGDLAWEAARVAGEPVGRAVGRLLGDSERLIVLMDKDRRLIGEIQKTRDDNHLLAFRVGVYRGPKDFLDPWVRAVFAASAGREMATMLIDDENSRNPKTLPAFSPQKAKQILRDLVSGYLEGHTRPLCYAPVTSDLYAKTLEKKGEVEALAVAEREWSKDDARFGPTGEGLAAAAQWAWRDRDAFAEGECWQEWAERVAVPLRLWGGFK